MTTTQELLDALAVVKSRAAADPNDRCSRGVKLWAKANELWSDEYRSWKTLATLGHTSAAECAWQRRTVAADLAALLLKVAL